MRRSARTGARGRAPGFTLIELLVALVIMQVGILSLVGVIPLTQAQITRAEHEARAGQLVRERLESLCALATSDTLLTAGGPYADPRNPIDGRFARSHTVVDDQPITGCKLVTVTVGWTERAGARRVQASTVLSEY